MTSDIKISPFIVFIVFYCMLASAYACVTLGYSFWIEFAAALICYLYFESKKAFSWTTASKIASLMLVVAAFYTMRGANLAGYVGMFMTISLAVVMLSLKKEWQIELLKIVSKWFSVLLLLSIIAWLLHFILPLPHSTKIEDSDWGYSITISNYLLFRESVISGMESEVRRFQSFFLEPGHLGTIVSFFIIANQFDFKKKENIIFLICILLSLSASAYVLLALGFLFYTLSKNKSKKIIGSLILVLGVIVFFVLYNGGDNIVNELIIGKLTREEGAVEGRVSSAVLSTYENMLKSGTDMLFGKGIFEEDLLMGAGMILFFVRHGLVGVVLLILCYFFLYNNCKSRYGLFIFIIVIVSFLQRTYPFWDAFLFPYIWGLAFARHTQNKDEKHNSVQVNVQLVK